jgi:hypothetical protein
MNIEHQLHVEIADELDNLSKMDVGTEEYRVTVDGVTKLVDRAIEMEKLAAAKEEQLVERKFDRELKLQQMREEKLDRYVRNGIAIAGILLPIGVTIWGTLKSFEFEKEGTITTIMGRGFINKLLPKK